MLTNPLPTYRSTNGYNDHWPSTVQHAWDELLFESGWFFVVRFHMFLLCVMVFSFRSSRPLLTKGVWRVQLVRALGACLRCMVGFCLSILPCIISRSEQDFERHSGAHSPSVCV